MTGNLKISTPTSSNPSIICPGSHEQWTLGILLMHLFSILVCVYGDKRHLHELSVMGSTSLHYT